MSQLYYLQSRYYDPETGRFINAATADILQNAKYNINGLNLYTYCNNPVAGKDSEGDASSLKRLVNSITAVVTTAIEATVFEADALVASGTLGSAMLAITSTFSGAAKGAAICAVVSTAIKAATSAVQCSVESSQEIGTLVAALFYMCHGSAKGYVQGVSDG